MKRFLLFLLLNLFIFGLSYLFRWNLYYLFLNPIFIFILFPFLFSLCLLFKFPFRFSIILSIIILLSLFILNQYLLKVDIKKGPPFSEVITEKRGEEEEFYGNLLLSDGNLTIKGLKGENLFIFDYYSPIKLMGRYTIKNKTGKFKVMDANSIFDRYRENEYKFYVNQKIKTKVYVRGKSLNINGDLMDTSLYELDIKGNVLYIDTRLGGKEKIFKLNLNSTSLMGEIEILDGSYVEIRISNSYLINLPKDFKEIERGFYVKEGDKGRIYINVKSKGTILTIKEERSD